MEVFCTFAEVSPSIGKVRVKHMRKLIALKGTVIRSGGVKMIEYERCYMCRKCKHRFVIHISGLFQYVHNKICISAVLLFQMAIYRLSWLGRSVL
jgi:DNA replicative helicase MCM subunit Mcm2 (Cdc46/Mcm family)